MKQPLIELKEVSHNYGKLPSVQNINLHISKGEVLCLLGPSGSGKSTLLRIIAGLEQIQEGELEINGSVVANKKSTISANKRDVGMLFQDYGLFPHMTVLENVIYGLSGEKAKRVHRGKEVLRQVGMDGSEDRFPHTLSGGQQQRVALARAIAPEPSMILLDEPFSGLDSKLRHQLRRDTLQVIRSSGLASVVVTHDPEEAMYMADRIVLLNHGRIVQIGKPESLYFKPKSSFVASFFGEVNIVKGRVESDHFVCDLGKFALARDSFEEGQMLMAFIRYEAFEVLGSQLVAKDRSNLFLAEIKESHLLGAQRLSRLSVKSKNNEACPTTDLFAKHYATEQVRIGETILCRLDQRHVHYFPVGNLKS